MYALPFQYVRKVTECIRDPQTVQNFRGFSVE
jgi:hypothetical protein